MARCRRRFVCLAGGMSLLSRAASGQVSGYAADRLILAPAPDDGLAIMRPVVSAQARLFGSLTVDYLRRPLHTGPITDKPDVKRAFPTGIVSDQAYAYATVGAELASRFCVSLTMPASFVDTSNDPGGRLPNLEGHGIRTNPRNAGDARLDVRARLFTTDGARFSMAVAGTLFAPTGSDTAFTGDGATHGLAQVLFEQRLGRVAIDEFVGVHFRPEKTIGESTSFSALRFGNEAVFGVGAFVPVGDGRLRLGIELYGQTGIARVALPDGTTRSTFLRSFDGSPAEWLGQARFSFGEGRATWLRIGVGTVLSPGYSAPDVRGVIQLGHGFELSR